MSDCRTGTLDRGASARTAPHALKVLPVDAPDFESAALRACELVLAGDARIGKIPGARTSKPRSKADGRSPKQIKASKKHGSTINFDTVRKIGLALPEVEESTAYGAPALKVRGKLLACVPTHRSAEPGSLVVRVGFEDRAELLSAAPDVYYVTDHYLNTPPCWFACPVYHPMSCETCSAWLTSL